MMASKFFGGGFIEGALVRMGFGRGSDRVVPGECPAGYLLLVQAISGEGCVG